MAAEKSALLHGQPVQIAEQPLFQLRLSLLLHEFGSSYELASIDD